MPELGLLLILPISHLTWRSWTSLDPVASMSQLGFSVIMNSIMNLYLREAGWVWLVLSLVWRLAQVKCTVICWRSHSNGGTSSLSLDLPGSKANAFVSPVCQSIKIKMFKTTWASSPWQHGIGRLASRLILLPSNDGWVWAPGPSVGYD